MSVPSERLRSGHSMPWVGLGTWLAAPGVVAEAVREALKAGYRHVDCAHAYMNQKEIGEVFKRVFEEEKSVQRSDVFITSKIWNTFHSYPRAKEAITTILSELQLEYLDLMLIHWPMGYEEGGEFFPKDGDKFRFSDEDYLGTWKAMEEAVAEGKIRSLGVSNFNHTQLERVAANATVQPSMIQVELHPYFQQRKLRQWCKEKGIAITAYSSLGNPSMPFRKKDDPNILHDTVVGAIATKLNKSPAQVALRWAVQHGIHVIPKSTNPVRIKENLDLFSFSLSDEDLKAIDDLDKVMAALLAESAQLTVDLLRVSSSPSESFVLSPYSLACAMAIVHDGAGGSTQKELTRLLAKGEQYWAPKHFSLKEGYARHVEELYAAGVEKLDFNHKELAAKRMNDFVSQNTREKIKEIIKEKDIEGAESVLINAVYFKGSWKNKFEALSTEPQTFHGVEGDKEIPFMHGFKMGCHYKIADALTVLSLPYKDDSYSLLILMPDGDFAAWRERFTGRQLLDALKDLEFGYVNVDLPKYKMEASLDGKKVLIKLGIQQIFTVVADFSEMTDSDGFHIEKIIHKAVIDVTETGTEAAAATAMVPMGGGSLSRQPPRNITIDRSFLYAIVCKVQQVSNTPYYHVHFIGQHP